MMQGAGCKVIQGAGCSTDFIPPLKGVGGCFLVKVQAGGLAKAQAGWSVGCFMAQGVDEKSVISLLCLAPCNILHP